MEVAHEGRERSRRSTPRSRIAALTASSGNTREPHVLRDGEIGNERGILVDRDDAGAARLGGRAKATALRRRASCPGVGGEHAGEDLDQRALARAIGAHQRMDFARAHFEVGRAQRPTAPKLLAMP